MDACMDVGSLMQAGDLTDQTDEKKWEGGRDDRQLRWGWGGRAGKLKDNRCPSSRQEYSVGMSSAIEEGEKGKRGGRIRWRHTPSMPTPASEAPAASNVSHILPHTS